MQDCNGIWSCTCMHIGIIGVQNRMNTCSYIINNSSQKMLGKYVAWGYVRV